MLYYLIVSPRLKAVKAEKEDEIMTVKECYKRLGADYDEVFRRLRSDERIERFLGMLLRDDSYAALVSALEQKDYETAFRAAHTMKGVYMNLNITSLAKSSSMLTEALRGGCDNGQVQPLFEQVTMEYQEMVKVIGELTEGRHPGGGAQ